MWLKLAQEGFSVPLAGEVMSASLPTGGKHMVWLTFSNVYSGIKAGLIPASAATTRAQPAAYSQHMVFITGLTRGIGYYKGSGDFGGTGRARMGMWVDMDAREFVLFRCESDGMVANAVRLQHLPADVRVAVYDPKHGLSVTMWSQDIPPPALDFSVIPMLRDVPDATLIRERPWEHEDHTLRGLIAASAYSPGVHAPIGLTDYAFAARAAHGLAARIHSPRAGSPARAGSPLLSPRHNRLGVSPLDVPSCACNDDLYASLIRQIKNNPP